MNFFDYIKNNDLGSLLLTGNFGLEKENVRTDFNGNISLKPHPKVFGDKAAHPYITTDFSEAQVELVTPTFATSNEALKFVGALHDIVSLELEDEVLWPYSLPPILPSDESLIKEAQFNNPEITEYREYLAHKYGKKKQLLSGVHFNFSFSDKFLKLMYDDLSDNISFREFRDQIYLKVARYYLKYSWLVIYLTGANSVAHESYINCCNRKFTQITEDSFSLGDSSSFRNGISGYRNLEHFYVSYNSLYDYIEDIQVAIDNGHIIAAKEYYSQLRLKGTSKGGVLEDLYNNGINYVEIRTLDLNPLVKNGITQESLDLIHLLMCYSLIAPDFYMSDEEYRHANQNQILAADENRANDIMLFASSGEMRELHAWGSEFLQNVYDTLKTINIESGKLQVLLDYKSRLDNDVISYACEITKGVKQFGYKDFFMQKSEEYLDITRNNYYRFTGFEDLELSTQTLLREAIKEGVKFRFIDRQDNFVELSRNNTSELVKQATKTSLDNYATVLAMENKLVSKDMMQLAKIITPTGDSYDSLDDALLDYRFHCQKAKVIKPNSTNFGVGVTIFKDGFTLKEYNVALNKAFAHDSKILVEDLVAGKEYRFFVIGDETVAVLHREPANVIGDGIHSIRQLVAEKNLDPLRSIGYVTPLEKLDLGEIEANFLMHQNLTFDSILEKNHKVYLRENSNISTGGDSIDYTDIVPKAYKRIAVKAAKSVGAVICGVDMMIKNINNPYPENNYVVIELNFNPAIHIHTYPYKGKNRQLARKILQALKLI